MRLELTRRNRHYPLKVACLPIPPPAQKKVPRTGLEPACLSTHAPETCASTNSATWAFGTRTRDPNLGKVMLYQLSYFRDNGCKDTGIFLFSKSLTLLFYTIFLHIRFRTSISGRLLPSTYWPLTDVRVNPGVHHRWTNSASAPIEQPYQNPIEKAQISS